MGFIVVAGTAGGTGMSSVDLDHYIENIGSYDAAGVTYSDYVDGL